MRSLKTLASAAVVAAGLGVAAPAAAHATVTVRAAGPVKTDACASALAGSDQAQAAFDAAREDLRRQVTAGGHPGADEWQNLRTLHDAAEEATSEAAQACSQGAEGDGGEHSGDLPHGSVHAGSGGMSQGVDGAETALGAALVGAAGLGLVLTRRRRIGAAAMAPAPDLAKAQEATQA